MSGTAAPREDASVWRRQMELPRYLRKVHGRGSLADALRGILSELHFGRPQLVSGPTVTLEFAGALAADLGLEPPLLVAANGQADVESLHAAVRGADVLVAVGGGRTIDVTKAACQLAGLPVVAVPTQLTADGIASPVSVIRAHSGQIESGRARLPIGVVVDLDFVSRSSPERVRAGIGDLIANPCAVRDWRLAAAAGREEVDDFAALLARSAADLVYGTDGATIAELGSGKAESVLLERLLDGLVLSGLAMEIAGSSRPCSGSEHLVSHAIDRLHPGTAQHGEQVALGALVCTRLQGEDWAALRQFLVAAGMDGAVRGFDLSIEQIAAAIDAAPATRPNRYTVLDELTLSPAELRAAVAEVTDR